jgi:hypothetical protein
LGSRGPKFAGATSDRRRSFPTKFPVRQRDGAPMTYDSGDYAECQRRALARAGVQDFEARRAQARREGRRLGLGVSAYVEATGRGPYESGAVRNGPSGKIIVTTGASAQGQGTKTMLAQVAADVFNLPLEQVSLNGTRMLSMDDFAIDYLTNGLDPGELLLAIEFPKCKPRSGIAFEEFSRRPADLAIVSAASVIELGPSGVIERLAIAIGGLGAGPTRLRDFERSCVGAHLDQDVVRTVSAAARQQPAVGQGEYSADYRSHLAGVLCARSITNAAQRAEREVAHA